MEALEREEVGPFRLEGSVPLETLQKTIEDLEKFFLPPSLLVAHLGAVSLDPEGILALCHGKTLPWEDGDPSDLELQEPLRILNAQGRLCAIGAARSDDRTLRPLKVFGTEGLL
jgi:tRNA U55 pseudouridine synthase TruB